MESIGQNFYIGQESQVAQFVKKWQPQYNYMEPKYKSLCTDLQNTLHRIFPRCTVHRFGSTVTNLYFTDSDVDIFVELGDRNISNVKKCIQKSTTLLRKYGNIFKEITAILSAKTPIGKFVHVPTNIRCDFNFKSVIGVYNSWFVNYFLSLDQRLGHLMLVIKYWAKMHGLSGVADFSNYSLVLLFIFYLQHVHLLPPVIYLQTVNSMNVQEDWNVGIDNSLSFTSQSLNDSTAEDILFGFFDYYAYFNYDLDIICPFLGRPITKDDFIQFHSLESQFQLYKINTTVKKPLQLKAEICLQDPFEHINNVTARVQSDCLKKFVALCKEACQIFEKRPVSCHALDDLFQSERPVGNRRKNRRSSNIGNKVKQMFDVTQGPTSRKKKRKRNQRNNNSPLNNDSPLNNHYLKFLRSLNQ